MSRSGSHSRSSSHRRSDDKRNSRSDKKDRKSSSRHRDDDRKRHRSTSSKHAGDDGDDEDERLLKQAKEFIEQQKKSKHKSRSSSSKRRSRSKSPERSRKRHRRDRDDNDDKHKDHDDRHDDDNDDKPSKKSSSRDDRNSSSRKSHRRRDDDDYDNNSDGSRNRGKDKEKSRRRRSPYSSSADDNSSDDKKHKRHSKKEHKKHSSRKKEDKKDKRKKDRKKDDKKDKTSSHNKKSEPSNNTKNTKHKKPDKAKLVPLGDPLGKPPTQLLDTDRDYFAYHQPLWVWLYREEGSVFNDMTSDETREAFGRFVEQFNAGQLEAAYYDEKGLPPAAVEECKTTRHKWSFQTNETERKGLKLLEDGVRKLTEYADPSGGKEITSKKNVCVARKPAPSVAPRPNPQQESSSDGRRQPWTTEERLAHQAANKRLKQHVRAAEEEFSGGAKDYGRERQLEKKREIGARTHGAARDREDPGVAISDDALYGDGGHGGSFQAALERERQRKARRDDSKQARIQELQQKDDAKKKAMLESLGLSNIAATGQKIKIAPRQDGNAGK